MIDEHTKKDENVCCGSTTHCFHGDDAYANLCKKLVTHLLLRIEFSRHAAHLNLAGDSAQSPYLDGRRIPELSPFLTRRKERRFSCARSNNE